MPRGRGGFRREITNSASDFPDFCQRRSRAMYTISSARSPAEHILSERNHKGFTLAEAARNTERHHSWSIDVRLRHAKIDFVCAENVERPEVEGVTLSKHVSEASLKLDTRPLNAEAQVAQRLGQDYRSLTKGHTAVSSSFSEMRCPASPSVSDSSEEVILFTGRNAQNPCDVESRSQSAPRALLPFDLSTQNDGIEVENQEASMENVDFPERLLETNSYIKSPEMMYSSSILLDAFGAAIKRPVQTTENTVVNYVDDNRQSGSQVRKRNDSDGSMTSMIEDHSLYIPLVGPQQTHQSSYSGWDVSNIHDFDDMSTSDGVMGLLQVILSKRERNSGTQYLVVWADQPEDEARWVPVDTLIGYGAQSHIEAFESRDAMNTETSNLSGVFSKDYGDENLDRTDPSKLLGKKLTSGGQFEALSTSDMQIDALDVGEEETEPVLLDIDLSVPASWGKKTSRRKSRRAYELPAASALANAYDGSDALDVRSQGLTKKPKSRRTVPMFDVSDSDLEATLRLAWDTDRWKKNQRKQERKDLRANGLLKSKDGRLDLKQKYKEGIGFHDVKQEIKAFLLRGDTTLSFPPMGKAERKMIHELANAISLKSKSLGNGDKRYPVLIRTQRTWTSSPDSVFEVVEARIKKGFLPRKDIGGKPPLKRPSRGPGGGGSRNVAVCYRDGDIVGASAPELGIDNKGRTMLEKMGWSRGTALGALNNKGILQPVSHVVKITKAGLG